MNFRTLRVGLLISLFMVIIVSVADGARKGKKKFRPKQIDSGIATMLFGTVRKQIILTSDTPAGSIERVGQIRNVELILGDGKVFPSRELIEQASVLGKPLTIVIPPSFQEGHRRRLRLLADYGIILATNNGQFNEDALNRVIGLGPRRRRVDINMSKVDDSLTAIAKRLKGFDLRVLVDSKPTNKQKKLIKKLGAGSVEFVVSSTMPLKQMQSLAKIKKASLTIHLENAKIDRKMARGINKMKRVDVGFLVDGILKPQEAKTFLLVDKIAWLRVNPQTWRVSEAFVRMMNAGSR